MQEANSLKFKDTFCISPFIEIDCFADGSYTPCCKFKGKLHHQGNVLSASTHSILDAWNSDSLQNHRKKLINNERPDECSFCWEQEALGLNSMRILQNGHYENLYKINRLVLIEKFQKGQLDLLRLHLRMSNKCNLKCRICSPSNSSVWAVESGEFKHKKPVSYYTKDNWKALNKLFPTLRYINILGGEPLVLEENIRLLKLIVKAKYNNKIEVEFATNGTIFSKEICKLYLKFKKAKILFSVDDLGNRFNYQRKNASFDRVWGNIKKYQNFFKKQPSISYTICITVSLFNVYYLPKLLEEIYRSFPDMHIILNILHDPEEMAIWNIDDAVKREIQTLLFAIPEYIRAHLREKCSGEIADIIAVMNGRSRNDLTPSFINAVKHVDRIRGEVYENVFPEFWSLIKPSV